MKIIYLCLGGMIGTLMRYFIAGWASKVFGPGFPYGTLAVNLLGCLLIGFLAGLAVGRGAALSPELQIFLVVGFCGAFTTFSTFSYDSFKLMQTAEFFKLFLNMAINVIIGFLAVWGGVVWGIVVLVESPMEACA